MQKRHNKIPLLTVIIIACVASACQPTPEKEIVQDQNNDMLEQKQWCSGMERLCSQSVRYWKGLCAFR